MWTLHSQPQHCGAQLHARAGKRPAPGPENDGRAPHEATRDRAAQEHDRAGDNTLQPGDYPASPIEHADHDNTPSAPEPPRVAWDDVVQPEQGRGRDRDDQPLPEGK